MKTDLVDWQQWMTKLQSQVWYIATPENGVVEGHGIVVGGENSVHGKGDGCVGSQLPGSTVLPAYRGRTLDLTEYEAESLFLKGSNRWNLS
ncbi:hypothetical protein BHE74_00007655 [Ensete ventricosum]|nr:hypothetical protein GW17_00061572 [Ensete ventricosum]RWW83823.1 hypothetical protein BHE74_00007655 [Ensete ventricosum]